MTHISRNNHSGKTLLVTRWGRTSRTESEPICLIGSRLIPFIAYLCLFVSNWLTMSVVNTRESYPQWIWSTTCNFPTIDVGETIHYQMPPYAISCQFHMSHNAKWIYYSRVELFNSKGNIHWLAWQFLKKCMHDAWYWCLLSGTLVHIATSFLFL